MKLLAHGTATDGSRFNLYLDESAERKPSVSPFVEVDKDAFWAFVNSYPNPLEVDEFMDTASWNDFTKHEKWPESVVAMINYGFPPLNIPDKYKIFRDVPAKEAK